MKEIKKPVGWVVNSDGTVREVIWTYKCPYDFWTETEKWAQWKFNHYCKEVIRLDEEG